MSFSKDIGRFNEKTIAKTEKVFRGAALSIYGKITIRTPVDTGRARGNWQIGINSKPQGEGHGSPTGIGNAKLGDTIWIVNNLPYILALEHGWSDQAPQGMVKITIAEYDRIVTTQVRA